MIVYSVPYFLCLTLSSSSISQFFNFVISPNAHYNKDNCPATMNVEVIVKSNEYDHNSVMGRLVKHQKTKYNEQVKFYYQSKR